MAIRKEAFRLRLNLLQRKASRSIQAISTIKTSGERTREAPNADSLLVIANRIRERNARGPEAAIGTFVDMRCCLGW
jgi:hypothetical protein